MSLLERLGRGHLSDAQLAKYWTEMPAEGSLNPHLAACAECRARYAEFERWITGLGDELRSGADEAFTADRLAVQQAQIVRRLETLERPARVIAFPAGHAQHEPTVSRTRAGSRWVAAAAVAGLVVGVVAGRFGHDYGRPGASRVIVARTAEEPELRATGTTATIREVSASISDDEFLNQIEIAIDGPSAAALQPIDDLTPRAWDVR